MKRRCSHRHCPPRPSRRRKVSNRYVRSSEVRPRPRETHPTPIRSAPPRARLARDSCQGEWLRFCCCLWTLFAPWGSVSNPCVQNSDLTRAVFPTGKRRQLHEMGSPEGKSTTARTARACWPRQTPRAPELELVWVNYGAYVQNSDFGGYPSRDFSFLIISPATTCFFYSSNGVHLTSETHPAVLLHPN